MPLEGPLASAENGALRFGACGWCIKALLSAFGQKSTHENDASIFEHAIKGVRTNVWGQNKDIHVNIEHEHRKIRLGNACSWIFKKENE